jgi:hypothetical protein
MRCCRNPCKPEGALDLVGTQQLSSNFKVLSDTGMPPMELELSPQVKLRTIIWLIYPSSQPALEEGEGCWKNCMRCTYIEDL